LGDSVTFGAIVPAKKNYTRVLGDKLINNGYNVEVINIAYGGWGTDQELEALINEGLRFKPNLIIVQFCKNDITDNAYFYYASEGAKRW
jgi:lysophospholipase L1-like esterase